jgi:hypothetical protein
MFFLIINIPPFNAGKYQDGVTAGASGVLVGY